MNLPNDEDDSMESSEHFARDSQLGFLSKSKNILFEDKDWNNWDGGKIGGMPIWLDWNIPHPDDLICVCCLKPTVFLLQIYCPLDSPIDAFHRCIYVFVCTNGKCIEKDSRSVVVLRCQVSEYQFNNSDLEFRKPKLCYVCGCKALSVCSNCKNVFYCSKNHQVLHWSNHKNNCNPCSSNVISEYQPKLLFPELSIEVDEENEEQLPEEENQVKLTNEIVTWDGPNSPVFDEEDDINQSNFSEVLGNHSSDPIYDSFLTLIQSRGSGLVLVYNRWIDNKNRICSSREEKILEPSIPVCANCKSCRKIEFQVLPQLLYHMHVEKNQAADKTIDWSLLDIYTCSTSCSYEKFPNGSNYIKEFGRIQKSVAFHHQRWS